MSNRKSLQRAAVAIAARYEKPVSSPWQALHKLFIARRYDRSNGPGRQIDWKRGELAEVLEAILTSGDWRSELGDCGYYIAQTWTWLWALYTLVVPADTISSAVEKFERRAYQAQSSATE